MVKVIGEGRARPIPQGYSVAGVDDGDDGTDWEPPPNAGATREWELWNEGGDPLVQAHGNFGTTETIDPTDGNVHTGTLNADCTVTLSAPSGTAAEIILWVTQDGTGGRVITWAGSVTENGSPDTTAGVTNRAILSTVDGGTTWIVDWVGGGGSSVAALDDLTDVTITSPQEDDTLRYVSGEWVNDNRRWEAVTDGEDVFVWEGDDLVHEWNGAY